MKKLNLSRSSETSTVSCIPSRVRRPNVRIRHSRRADRRGGVTLWLVLFLPVLLILLVTVAEVGHLLLSRQQVKNSLDAAASAAAARWGKDGGANTQAARDDGLNFGAFNHVARNQPLLLNANYDATLAQPNQNKHLNGATAHLIFGKVTGPADSLTLDANSTASSSGDVAKVIASGRYGNGNRTDDFLRIEFLTTSPTTSVIRELWIDLRSGTEPGNNAVFVFPPSNWGLQSSSGPPTSPATITFHTALPPTGANQVNANARAIRIVFPATDFTARTITPRFWQQAGLRTQNLGAGANSNTGDALGIYGIQGRLVTQAVPPSGATSVQTFTFPNNGTADLLSQQSITIPDTSSPLGVRAAAAVEIPSLLGTLVGIPLGPYTVRAESSAVYNRGSASNKVKSVKFKHYNPNTIPNSP